MKNLAHASIAAFRRGLSPKPPPVKVRVLVPLPFRIGGVAVKVGDIVMLEEYDVNTQITFKRVERV